MEEERTEDERIAVERVTTHVLEVSALNDDVRGLNEKIKAMEDDTIEIERAALEKNSAESKEVCKYKCMYMCIYTYSNICLYVYICKYIYVCIYICICVYVYI
jgi:hypothetical protein